MCRAQMVLTVTRDSFHLYGFALDTAFLVNSAFSRVHKVGVHEEHDGGGEESFDVINHKRSD